MLGIVILNYMTWSETKKCVESILSTCTLKYGIFIVDNGSTNSSCEILKTAYAGYHNITIIKLNHNLGYAAGNNIGIKTAIQANADNLLISNNDIIYKDKAIEKMNDYLWANPDAEIVGPKIRDNYSKLVSGRFGKLGMREKYLVTTPLRILDFLFTWRKYFYSDIPENLIHEIYAISGSCFMIKRSAIEKVGYLDENTFLYQEEAILGFRAAKLGYKSFFLPSAQVIHAHAATTRHYSAFSYRQFVLSEIYYCAVYLRTSLAKYFALYIIRIVQYITRCLTQKDYRANLKKYLVLTWNKLSLFRE
jgi:GT2 family glycosyltransferase